MRRHDQSLSHDRAERAFAGDQCDEWQGSKSVDELTGATSQDGQSEKDMLFNQGTGLGIMFYDFKGRLEKYSDVWENLMLGRELEKRLVTARFLINPASCHRTKKYLNEYRSKNLGDHYGLYLRPRHQEGAGCTAFASSVLEIAGILNADIKSAWSKEVRVQEKYIGHPVADRTVKVNTLLFSSEAKKWATLNEPHRKLFFYDTQFMYSWLKKIWDAGMKGKWPKGYAKDEQNYKQWHQKIWVTIPAPGTIDGWEDVYVSNGVMSIVADMRILPTPTENFWLKP